MGFSLVTSVFATQPRVGSIPATRDGDTSHAAALLAAFLRSVVGNAQPFFPRKTMGVTAPSTRCLALIAFSSIFRWLSCVISSASPTRSGPWVISRYPAITSLSSSLSNASTGSYRTTMSSGDGFPQHTLFISAFNEEHRNMMYDIDPFIALSQF